MDDMTAAEVRARAVIERLPSGPVVGVEVGVHDGRMSAHLLRLRSDLGLVMVDNWKAAERQSPSYRATADPRATLAADEQDAAMRQAIAATDFAQNRRIVYHNDSTRVARILDHLRADFVFIDADHSYEGVIADIRAWRPRVKPGGLLCGHDYEPRFPGVARAVAEAAALYGWTVETGDNFTWFVRP